MTSDGNERGRFRNSGGLLEVGELILSTQFLSIYVVNVPLRDNQQNYRQIFSMEIYLKSKRFLLEHPNSSKYFKPTKAVEEEIKVRREDRFLCREIR